MTEAHAAAPNFEALYREHHSALLGLALRLLSHRQDAEDAVQEAFVAAWSRRRRAMANPLAWLCIATRYAALDLLVGRARRATPYGVLPADASTDLVALRIDAQALEVSARLDAAGVPRHWGAPRLRRVLAELGIPIGNERLADVIVYRRSLLNPGPAVPVEVFRQVYASLTDRQRQVLQLRYVDGLPVAEVAQRMGITPDGVKRRALRARAEMKAKVWVEVTPR